LLFFTIKDYFSKFLTLPVICIDPPGLKPVFGHPFPRQ